MYVYASLKYIYVIFLCFYYHRPITLTVCATWQVMKQITANRKINKYDPRRSWKEQMLDWMVWIYCHRRLHTVKVGLWSVAASYYSNEIIIGCLFLNLIWHYYNIYNRWSETLACALCLAQIIQESSGTIVRELSLNLDQQHLPTVFKYLLIGIKHNNWNWH